MREDEGRRDGPGKASLPHKARTVLTWLAWFCMSFREPEAACGEDTVPARPCLVPHAGCQRVTCAR